MGLMKHACDDPMCRRCIREQPEDWATIPGGLTVRSPQITPEQFKEQPERRDVPVEDTYGVLGSVADRIRDYHRGHIADRVKEILDGMQPTAALTGYAMPTPRELAEEKVRQLLEWDKPTKALAFKMLRNDGMDSDRANLILRDAKWTLP